MNIYGLHHSAYRCRDSEETRSFYEDFLGLPLAEALEIAETKTGGKVHVLHTFFRMDDGSFIAFFEVPHMTFEFKNQHDFDLHIALEASPETSSKLIERAHAENRDVRGPVDHGIGYSVYFRDPNGYVVELLNRKPEHDELLDPNKNRAREKLKQWQIKKNG